LSQQLWVFIAKLRMCKRRATGRCEGRKPFGEHPGEEPVLRHIRQLHRKPRGRERLSNRGAAQRGAAADEDGDWPATSPQFAPMVNPMTVRSQSCNWLRGTRSRSSASGTAHLRFSVCGMTATSLNTPACDHSGLSVAGRDDFETGSGKQPRGAPGRRGADGCSAVCWPTRSSAL
jgi:hypothetical protein